MSSVSPKLSVSLGASHDELPTDFHVLGDRAFEKG